VPTRGIIGLRSSQTSAVTDDWAGVIFPAQGVVSLGAVLTAGLRRFSAPVVALMDAGRGRIIITTHGATQASLRALVPSVAATLTPVLVYGQSATQWTLADDAWNYAGGMLATVTLPQLSKRTVGALADKVLNASPANGFLLADQAGGGVVRVWSDFNGDAATALDAITPAGDTVCAEMEQTYSPLPFEGGEV
jgi:hypothetical protein